MPFKDGLNTTVTIGKFTTTLSNGDPTRSWSTSYKSDAYIQTLTGREVILGDNNQVIARHRIFLPATDAEGDEMTLNETMEAVEGSSLSSPGTALPRYHFVIVDKPHGHHFEVACRRVTNG